MPLFNCTQPEFLYDLININTEEYKTTYSSLDSIWNRIYMGNISDSTWHQSHCAAGQCLVAILQLIIIKLVTFNQVDKPVTEFLMQTINSYSLVWGFPLLIAESEWDNPGNSNVPNLLPFCSFLSEYWPKGLRVESPNSGLR